MSVNRAKDHIVVLVEDEANRRILNGFLLDSRLELRAVQPLPNCGGWRKVCEYFCTSEVEQMRANDKRHVLLIIDFDGDGDRLKAVNELGRIPAELSNRVMVVGCAKEPEALKRSTKCSLEEIGVVLAEECFTGRHELWSHVHLTNNESELVRVGSKFRGILFGVPHS